MCRRCDDKNEANSNIAVVDFLANVSHIAFNIAVVLTV